MAFINEYISDEDMEKYKIVDVWREFYREQRPPNDKPRRKMSWTIDKERNIYFIPMRSGRYEESHIKLCALWWDGVLLSVKIAKVGGLTILKKWGQWSGILSIYGGLTAVHYQMRK